MIDGFAVSVLNTTTTTNNSGKASLASLAGLKRGPFTQTAAIIDGGV